MVSPSHAVVWMREGAVPTTWVTGATSALACGGNIRRSDVTSSSIEGCRMLKDAVNAETIPA